MNGLVRKCLVAFSYVALLVVSVCILIVPFNVFLELYMPYTGYTTEGLRDKKFIINKADTHVILDNVKRNKETIKTFWEKNPTLSNPRSINGDAYRKYENLVVVDSISIIKDGKILGLGSLCIDVDTVTFTYQFGSRYQTIKEYNALFMKEAIVFEGVDYIAPPAYVDFLACLYKESSSSLFFMMMLVASPYVIAFFVVLRREYI